MAEPRQGTMPHAIPFQRGLPLTSPYRHLRRQRTGAMQRGEPPAGREKAAGSASILHQGRQLGHALRSSSALHRIAPPPTLHSHQPHGRDPFDHGARVDGPGRQAECVGGLDVDVESECRPRDEQRSHRRGGDGGWCKLAASRGPAVALAAAAAALHVCPCSGWPAGRPDAPWADRVEAVRREKHHRSSQRTS